MIVFVIVPPDIIGRMDLFMPKIEDGNVVRPSHYRIADHSSLEPRVEIGILPLFPDKSPDSNLVKHVMLIVKLRIKLI